MSQNQENVNRLRESGLLREKDSLMNPHPPAPLMKQPLRVPKLGEGEAA